MQFIAYLDFDGHCREAFDFYARVFNGRITMRMTYGESPMAGEMPPETHGRVMHSQLESGDGLNRADFLEPVREASANFLRRNEIEPTWLRPLGRRELGRIEIINQG